MTRLLEHRRDAARHSSDGVRRDEQGFTLVELLIVVVIMPLIVGAIAYGLVSVFSLQNSVTQRLSGSTDVQNVSAQFAKDVQSSEQVYLGSSSQQCGAAGVQLLGLSWSRGASMVSYVRVQMTNDSSNYALERLYCTLGDMTAPVATTVLSSDFYLTSASLTQDPPSVCQTSLTSCTTASGAYSAAHIAAVTFTMYVPMSSAPYTMVASPRGGASSIGKNGFTLTSPFTLLGQGSCTNLLTVGNGSLNILVQTTVGGVTTTVPGTLGVAYCPASAITLANKGAITASGVLTGTSSTDGITVGANPGSYPTSVNYDSGMTDPFSGIAAPTYSTTCTGSSCGACAVDSTGAYICTGGVYLASNTPNFPNNSTIYFTGADKNGNPETTVFDGDLKIPNGSNAHFQSGVYVYAANDAGAFSTGTSNVKNSGVSLTGIGVLFYTPTGGITFSNNSLVTLTGFPSTGTPYYDGITLWLGGTTNTPATGDGVLTLGNNSTQTNTYGGIYAPSGEVVDSNNGTIATTFIVTGTAVFSNGLNVTITSSS